MNIIHLNQMIRGWFVGNFEPTVYKTDACEAAVQKYPKGSIEKRHYHKIATEITVIVSGQVKMNGKLYNEGDIIRIEPGESTDFEAVTDAVTAVVKIPGVLNDKYLV